MKKNIIRLAAGLLLSAVATATLAVELVEWDRLPIPVPLVKDEERVVFLERNVRVGLASELVGRIRVQSAAGALYLKAGDDISPSRLQVQDVETGEIILLDIATVPAKEKPLEPLRILSAGERRFKHDAATQKKIEAVQDKALQIPAPVALTRYAAQMLYAPLRTVEPVAGIRQIPLSVSGELPVFPMLPVKTEAIAAFKMGSYTLTAVKIQHLSTGKIELDPRDAQASLYALTFQHNWLGSYGSAEDTTVAYMVTRAIGLEGAMPVALTPRKESADEE